MTPQRVNVRGLATTDRSGYVSQTTEEHWLPIVGYEGLYEVSNQGRVRSLDRKEDSGRGSSRPRRGQILKPRLRSGYISVHLSRLGIAVDRTVHSLVMEAFSGPRPDGMQVRHGNGDRTDSRLSNLSYGTQSDNEQDKLQQGRNRNASKTHCKWGHEFTIENTLFFPCRPRIRVCALCMTRRNHERYRAEGEQCLTV